MKEEDNEVKDKSKEASPSPFPEVDLVDSMKTELTDLEMQLRNGGLGEGFVW